METVAMLYDVAWTMATSSETMGANQPDKSDPLLWDAENENIFTL
jgi:hypothetical protein